METLINNFPLIAGASNNTIHCIKRDHIMKKKKQERHERTHDLNLAYLFTIVKF